MNKVELLAPAGDMDALVAAVQNGADAVYVGGRLFGARANASNFDGEGLEGAVKYCHMHGVKLYMTVNTLVSDSEMPQVYQMVAQAVDAGIDAAIVQDLGVAQMIKRCFPQLSQHASTQMSVASKRGAQYVKALGMTRVVPARECTLEEIGQIAQTGLEVEIFVHGALCVGYSGQCLLSSMIGGRSGNRGRCAQPCRLTYSMDGKKRYYLSPADLCALGHVPELVRAGATSLKIEGRLKRPEYVAIVTAAYRRALDAAQNGTSFDPSSDMEELIKIFNRGGFTRGYAFGSNDAGVMATERPNHWGQRVGSVLQVQNGRARVQLSEPLHQGDGLEARGIGGAHGVLVTSVDGNSIRVPEGVRAGDVLFRTTDAQQLNRAQQSYAKEHRTTKVDAQFTARIGAPCQLVLDGHKAVGAQVERATGRPLDAGAVRKQIGKLGDTVMELDQLECRLDEGAFLPVSALNALRRDAAQACEQAILDKNTPPQTILPYQPPQCTGAAVQQEKQMLLVLQSDSVDQLLAAQQDADALYYAPRDFREHALESHLKRLPEDVAVVLPTMLSDQELDQAMRAIGSRQVVCNNLAQLRSGFVADIGLNAFNIGTVDMLLKSGAVRVSASAECTLVQAAGLAKAAPVELIVHGNVPLMTLRHCPIRAQKGLDETGREQCNICAGEGTVLVDRKGESLKLLPYQAASGCRMQAFNAHLYSALGQMDRVAQAGFAALRVIGTHEDLLNYKSALNGEEVRTSYQQMTFGHLFRGVE